MSKSTQTVEYWLHWAAGQLQNAAVDTPALDAEVLLSHVLQCDRSVLLAHPNRTLQPEHIQAFRSAVSRRASREPLAYIVGHKEFYGLDLLVDRRVLIPRPETELLVELGIAWVQERQREGRPTEELIVVDMGTGSGAIAIALARHIPQLIVYALDPSSDALAVARCNIERHGLTKRIFLVAGDLLSPLSAPMDLILANLPYIATDELPALMPEVSVYEPRLALDGGPDGLGYIRRLLTQAREKLRAGGALFLEIGADQGSAVSAIARQIYPTAHVNVRKDWAGLDRILVIQT